MGRSSVPPKRVLVVDDEESIRHLYVELISTLPVEVDSVPCIEEAIRRLDACEYDVVVTDYFMPGGGTGLDLLRFVRERFPLVRIGIVTGSSGEEFKTQILAESPDFLMEKPVDIMAFLDTIGAMLERVSPRRASSSSR